MSGNSLNVDYILLDLDLDVYNLDQVKETRDFSLYQQVQDLPISKVTTVQYKQSEIY